MQRRLVLHHHDRVARLGQPAQHARQAAGVARVQAHRRLVQHVERAGQRAAERGRQRHPLRLAARQRARLPRRASGSRGPRRRGSASRPRTSRSSEATPRRRRRPARGRPSSRKTRAHLGDGQRLQLGQRAPEQPEAASASRLAAARRRRPRTAVAPVARQQHAHVHLVGARTPATRRTRSGRTTCGASSGARPARPPRRIACDVLGQLGQGTFAGSAGPLQEALAGRPGTRCSGRSGRA